MLIVMMLRVGFIVNKVDLGVRAGINIESEYNKK
jgi:hypothetical protein